MSAFIVIHSTIHDLEKFQEYAQAAPSTLAPFQGEFLLKGKLDKILSGDHNQKTVAIIKFPDTDAIENWYHSAEYQALIKNRDASADMDFIVYNQT